MFQGIKEAVNDMVASAPPSIVELPLTASSLFGLNAAVKIIDPNLTVKEISGSKEIQLAESYPVMKQIRSLTLHGPMNDSEKCQTKYNIILRAPPQPPFNFKNTFSLARTDDLKEAQKYFDIFKLCIVPLVDIDPQICSKSQLEKMCPVLRENLGWSAVHACAAFNLYQTYLPHAAILTSVNIQEETYKKTALHIAIQYKNVDTVNYLLSKNIVRLELTDDNHNTIIHQAVSSPDASPTILEKVIAAAKTVDSTMIDALNEEGLTALHIACKQDNIQLVQILLQAGANVNIPSRQADLPSHIAGKSPSVCTLEEIIGKKKDQILTKSVKDRGTPLHWTQEPSVITILLELGCDPNIVDDNGRSALHNAVEREDLRSAVLLLSHHGYVDVIDDDGNSPLNEAAKLCSRNLIKVLIVFRADINKKNKDGHTPRHLVCTSGKPEKEKAECLFLLDRVGALRCTAEMQNECSPGCIASGDFNGTQPPNLVISPDPAVIEEALTALSLKSTEENDSKKRNGPLSEPVGVRLLCLDGGGVRGLVLIQVLAVIEEVVGHPITKLFDWMSGTSTGGIITLGLATGKSLMELQALYMRLKDNIFKGSKPYSSEKMEQFLKIEFGEEKRMSDIQSPRVMITTTLVDKRPAELHLFRNYPSPVSVVRKITQPEAGLNEYVWQVAKWTGAAPSYFRLDGSRYVDGGLISNNPTLDALTELTQYEAAMKATKSNQSSWMPTVVVSVGCSMQPVEDIDPQNLDVGIPKDFNDAFNAISKLPAAAAALANLIVDQATQSDGQIVERARAWCSGIRVPFFRYSPLSPVFVDMDETKDDVLIDLIWVTRAYVLSDRARLMELKQILLRSVPGTSNK